MVKPLVLFVLAKISFFFAIKQKERPKLRADFTQKKCTIKIILYICGVVKEDCLDAIELETNFNQFIN